jgi:plasmid stabilization system protein ParE
MRLRIEWSQKAVLSFQKILAYLEVEWSDREVQRFKSATSHLLMLLSGHPEIGKQSAKNPALRAILVRPQVILLYSIEPDTILIVNLYDTRQNPDRIKD